MVDIKTLKISIRAIIKDPEMLEFVPDHLTKMCKHAVKKLPFLIKYVPDRYKTQQRNCDKVILKNNKM